MLIKKKLENQDGHLAWIDILKGIGIILVVIGHVYSNMLIYRWVYSFHMPLFFVAAGWLYREKPNWQYIKRRMQTILIPYFSFGLIILIYWQLVERSFRNSNLSFVESLIGLISGNYALLDFNVHMWFLPCFFITVVFYNLQRNAMGRKYTYIITAILSFLSFMSLPELPLGLNRMLLYIGFYALGNVAAEYSIEERIRSIGKLLQLMAFIVLACVSFILAYFGLTENIMWFVTGSIGVAACIILAILIEEMCIAGVEKIVGRALITLGQISLCILCVHGPIYRVLSKVVSVVFYVSADAARRNVMLSGIIVILTLFISFVAYHVILRIFPWMLGKKKWLDKRTTASV